jgi:hypothetical protein
MPSPVAAASDVKSAVCSAYVDPQAPQLLDQRIQTLIEVSDIPGVNTTCFFSSEADAFVVAAVDGDEQTRPWSG